ncbi:hypothetical protein [Paenibacillus donghaensis]|uniref:hypothetical protein n=1 Tax=Paenibacillus donghaensis TaxID=414771 RepID=UPI0012FD7060|nr:hypothetical protein [Paenibacillus donghaensis]
MYRKSDLLNGVTSALAFENDLEVEDFVNLATVHFVIKCYRSGIIDIIQQVMRNLDRNTQQDYVENRGSIKGVVDWGETFRRRAAAGFSDRSLFVTRPSNRVYDTSANQFLKFFLEFLYVKIPEALKIAPGKVEGWTYLLNEVFQTVRQARLHPHLREVSKSNVINYKLIELTSKNRNRYYRELSAFGDLYFKIFINKDQKALFSVLREQLLSPQEPDKLYEFVVLFEVISVLEEIRVKQNGKRKITILRAENKTIFNYLLPNNTTISAMYQYVPRTFSRNSKYVDTLKLYQIGNVKTRQPDIIINVEKSTPAGTISKNAVVEVKFSSDRHYIGEGVHDVLSYLADFQFALNQTPKAMLTVWSGIGQRPTNEKQNDIWLSDFRNLRSSLLDFFDALV